MLNAALSRGSEPVLLLLLREQRALLQDSIILDGSSSSSSSSSTQLLAVQRCCSIMRGAADAAQSGARAFEARSFSGAWFSAAQAQRLLAHPPLHAPRLQTLRLRQFHVSDAVLRFCCARFPALTCLDVGDNEALRNVPADIKMLTRLRELHLRNCSRLASLPDELLQLRASLTTVDARGCSSITFPPPSIALGGDVAAIFKYLEQAQHAQPLRRVKVMFLGNGRSGKTSLLRALAKQPLRPDDQGPGSTVGISVDTLQKQLKAGYFEKRVENLPDITYWDFAGQLERRSQHIRQVVWRYKSQYNELHR